MGSSSCATFTATYMASSKWSTALILGIFSLLMFLPYVGNVHLFDWDEINFAECAREMIVSGDYLQPQIDFMPFWEKPPLFIWLQVAAMKLVGINELAARLPNVLAGIVTLIVVYATGKKIHNRQHGLWWAAMFAICWLPHFYFRTGIIDPIFNLLIFLSFYQVHRIGEREDSGWQTALMAGIFLGLAALTKGPVGILVALLSFGVFLIWNKGWGKYRLWHLLIVAVFAALPFSMWIMATMWQHGYEYGSWFLKEFIKYQIRLFSTEDSDHGGPFFYHFVVLLVGCFPASVLLLQPLSSKEKQPFARWMWILFWVVLLLFSIVKTKIVHYSSLCYFPLTYLAAQRICAIQDGTAVLRKAIKAGLLGIGILVGILLLLLPVAGKNIHSIVPYVADKFAAANMRAHVQWHTAACAIGVLYIAGIVMAARQMRIHFGKGLAILCGAQLVTVQAATYYFTPRIEAISQRAAITYFQQFVGRRVYVQPLGYKSYANLFYTQKQPGSAPEYKGVRRDDKGRETPEANTEWLVNGTIDRPTVFICKVQDSVEYGSKPTLEVTGSSNGFVFLKRK